MLKLHWASSQVHITGFHPQGEESKALEGWRKNTRTKWVNLAILPSIHLNGPFPSMWVLFERATGDKLSHQWHGAVPYFPTNRPSVVLPYHHPHPHLVTRLRRQSKARLSSCLGRALSWWQPPGTLIRPSWSPGWRASPKQGYELGTNRLTTTVFYDIYREDSAHQCSDLSGKTHCTHLAMVTRSLPMWTINQFYKEKNNLQTCPIVSDHSPKPSQMCSWALTRWRWETGWISTKANCKHTLTDGWTSSAEPFGM